MRAVSGSMVKGGTGRGERSRFKLISTRLVGWGGNSMGSRVKAEF